MNRAQKIALFTLVMLVVALVLSLIAVCVAYFGFGLPLRRAASGFGFIGVMGLSALAPLLFRKNKQEVQLDERDLLIKRKAMLAAYGGVLAPICPGGYDSVVHHRAERYNHG